MLLLYSQKYLCQYMTTFYIGSSLSGNATTKFLDKTNMIFFPQEKVSCRFSSLFWSLLLPSVQCDQIWRFFGLWATINLPKSPTFLANFVKVSKSFIFLVKSFLGNFYRHLAIFFWSNCQCYFVSILTLADVSKQITFYPEFSIMVHRITRTIS